MQLGLWAVGNVRKTSKSRPNQDLLVRPTAQKSRGGQGSRVGEGEDTLGWKASFRKRGDSNFQVEGRFTEACEDTGVPALKLCLSEGARLSKATY